MRTHAGQWVRALAASQRSVRGPHPQRLGLDEIGEMPLAIFDAALGQPMGADGFPSAVFGSSTHQYPNGTVTAVLRRDYHIRRSCWRDSLDENGGWLTRAEVERKRATVPRRMWETEYELQEPSVEGRAFDSDMVDEMFDSNLGTVAGEAGEVSIFEAPVPDGEYRHGIDWAKEQDWTVIWTWRTDGYPVRLVAFERRGREPWPAMWARAIERQEMYGGTVYHDKGGVGSAADDVIGNAKVKGIFLQGEVRRRVWKHYTSAIEGGDVKAPCIRWAYDAHRYCTVHDLYGTGHPPDAVVAGALGWWANVRQPRLTFMPEEVGERDGPFDW